MKAADLIYYRPRKRGWPHIQVTVAADGIYVRATLTVAEMRRVAEAGEWVKVRSFSIGAESPSWDPVAAASEKLAGRYVRPKEPR